jgi:hypothetical protein
VIAESRLHPTLSSHAYVPCGAPEPPRPSDPGVAPGDQSSPKSTSRSPARLAGTTPIASVNYSALMRRRCPGEQ